MKTRMMMMRTEGVTKTTAKKKLAMTMRTIGLMTTKTRKQGETMMSWTMTMEPMCCYCCSDLGTTTKMKFWMMRTKSEERRTNSTMKNGVGYSTNSWVGRKVSP
jgi:hypothetical protein